MKRVSRPTASMSQCALALTLTLALAAVAGTAQAQDAGAADAGAQPALPACVQVATASRYVPFGYNHVVILKNGCSKAATCSVATDVNPQPTASEIASGQTVEVLTFAGSPSQAFQARVSCRLH